jgi:hypothetical protein
MDLNRLLTGTATSGAFINSQDACWSYDAWGNRKSESLSSTACTSNPPRLSWATYNTSNSNRMDTDSASTLYGATPVYDAAGNLESDVDGQDGCCNLLASTEDVDAVIDGLEALRLVDQHFLSPPPPPTTAYPAPFAPP